MKRAALILGLFLVGCGVDEAPTDVTGDWTYRWSAKDQPTMNGVVWLEQDGNNVTGRIVLPTNYDPALIDPATWDWKLTMNGETAQITPGPGCACDGVKPFDLSCLVTKNLIGCAVSRTDEFGDQSGQFSAER